MSKNSFIQKKDYLPTNSSIQKLNDNVIEIFLDYFKYYPISDEFKEIMEKNKEIFEENPIKPDLVLRNKVFNKNKCFIDANQEEINYFPRNEFKLKNVENQEKSNKAQNYIQSLLNTFPPSSIQNSQIDINKDNKLSFMNSLIISDIQDIKPYVGGGAHDSDEKRDDIIYLISSYMNNKGWYTYINGHNYSFTSYELFEFLTEEILIKNFKLDDIIIYNIYSCEKLKGGYLYLYLHEYLPLFLNTKNYDYNYNNRCGQLNQINNNDMYYNYFNYLNNKTNDIDINVNQNNYFPYSNYNNNSINGFN